MHMADALLSPAIGATFWAAAGGAVAYSCRRVSRAPGAEETVPLIGVMGAFIFAAQMINFTIPGTGSSGHLGGGLLLAALLGPHAALLVLASVLALQAILFADGGLLALGCNIFNLGVLPCLVAYPLLYKKLAGSAPSRKRIGRASVLAAVAALQLGSLGVVLETTLSGVSELPFTSFALLMQPIHLAVGLVEGLVTAAVIAFIGRARPELLEATAGEKNSTPRPGRSILASLLLAAALAAGLLSWNGSPNPDGLEWSIRRVSGTAGLVEPRKGVHPVLAEVQKKTALLPGYGFGAPSSKETIDAGTALSGLIGGTLTLAAALAVGMLLRRRPPTC